MDRRIFLKGATALFCAPAIVKADNIMRIWVPPEPHVVTVTISGLTEQDDWLLDYENKTIKYIGDKK